MIIEYILYSTRVKFETDKTNHRPLLELCQNFRYVYRPLYFRRLELLLDDVDFAECIAYYNRTGICFSGYLGPSTLCLVRHLDIQLDERAIYLGYALRMLSSAPYRGYVFPQARKLSITLFWDESEGSDTSDESNTIDSLVAKSNLDAFVQRVKYMVPSVNEISVQPTASSLENSGIVSHLFIDMASQLYRLANCVSHYCRVDSRAVEEVQFDNIQNLTSIAYNGEGLGDQFTQLARLNAPTLLSLTINTNNEEVSTSSLIWDVDGSWIVYPCLHKLKLSMKYSSDMLILFGSHVPVLFPRLRHLDLGAYCTFDMYVFFNGNSDSLEILVLTLDSQMVSMVQRYNLFTPLSHPRLKCVKIGYHDATTDTTFASLDEALQFAFEIGPSAPVREIRALSSANALLSAYPLLGQHMSIQVLSLAHTPLVLWDAIALIKLLPLLSDLHSGSASLGSIPAGTTMSNLPTYVRSTYAPMGQRFRCWHFNGDFRNNAPQVVECVLLLALVCPNFDYAAPYAVNSNTFSGLIRDTIASGKFGNYAARLQRLL